MKILYIILFSIFMTTAIIANAFYRKRQFYPSVVHITRSKLSMSILYCEALVLVYLIAKLVGKIFFGLLRPAEVEHLIDNWWSAITETCLAFAVFKSDLSFHFAALFVFLIFVKTFHWLAEDRVDHMDSMPTVSIFFHIRMVSLLTILAAIDILFIRFAYYSIVTKGVSVQLAFGFEYTILLAVTLNIAVKYVLHAIDRRIGNPWEEKAVYLLYADLAAGFLKVILYFAFIGIMTKIYRFPLFAIRRMYMSVTALRKSVTGVIMSRRAISHMSVYPDATQEEMASVDNVCVVCRDEMKANTAKKLPCKHIFHASCLRLWFRRQQTCPTCRLDVLAAPETNAAHDN